MTSKGEHMKERTSSKSGWGLPRQKFDSVQVALRSMDSLVLSLSCAKSGCSARCPSTRSRHCGESPAMLPSAQTACVPLDVVSATTP